MYKPKMFSRLFTVLLFAIALVVFTYGCTEDKIADPAKKIANSTDDLVLVQVDLQFGFSGKYIAAKFNDVLIFEEMLDESVSLAGPEASFSTHIPRGSNNLYIRGSDIEPLSQSSFSDNIDINLGNAEKYYLGVSLSSDTLIVVVQESIFLYM